MKKCLGLVLLFLALCVPIYSQTTILGATEITKSVGQSATISWECPVAPNLLFFRVRRSQATAGSYNVWVKLPKEVRQYQFIITDHITYQYFITAWYSVTDANGVIKTVESVGSNHLRITVSP